MLLNETTPDLLCPHHREEQCPCVLSEINQCPICSHLGGADQCNCNWSGRCIFLEARDQTDPPVVMPGWTRQAQYFQLQEAGIVYYAYAAPAQLAALALLSTVYLVHHQPPEYLSIPAVVIGRFPKKNIIVFALNASSIRETYYIKHQAKLALRGNTQPAVLGLERLDPAKKTLVTASGFGTMLLETVCKQFSQDALTVHCSDLPPFWAQRLIDYHLSGSGLNPSSFEQVVSLETLREQQSTIKTFSCAPVKIAILNTHIFY